MAARAGVDCVKRVKHSTSNMTGAGGGEIAQRGEWGVGVARADV